MMTPIITIEKTEVIDSLVHIIIVQQIKYVVVMIYMQMRLLLFVIEINAVTSEITGRMQILMIKIIIIEIIKLTKNQSGYEKKYLYPIEYNVGILAFSDRLDFGTT